MKKGAILTVIFALYASLSMAATALPVDTAAEFLKGNIDAADLLLIGFYDTDASGACTDGTYDTYAATNQVGTAAGYSLHASGSYTTSTTGSVAFIQSESFSTVTSLVATLSGATFTDADCIVIFADLDANNLDTGDPAIYQSDITSISPAGEDVTITFPADDSTNALIRMTVP
jgi:hypothetical protein